MPDIQASLSFLADDPLYKVEKPYYVFIRAEDAENSENQQLDNLRFVMEDNITIHDIRGRESEYCTDTSGFELAHHVSKACGDLSSAEAIEDYKREIEALHEERFDAEYSLCYEVRLRKNFDFEERTFDLLDPLFVEGPAIGAHNDVTLSGGPKIIDYYLSDSIKQRYIFSPGYRFQIVNTWRSLVPVLEDNPIAVCDARSIDPADLVPADRIIPTRVGETYFLRHNREQRWHWVEKMTMSEPLVLMMFDTHPGDVARYCPHISFQNSRAPADAVQRTSVESRSIVISKL